MARRDELNCVSYVIMPDSRAVQVDELTPEENIQWQANMTERLGEAMSDYYTQHPQEYINLSKGGC